MGKYISRRLAIAIPMIVAISMVTFLFINLAPGDPIDAMLDPEELYAMTEKQVESLRRHYGLDKPLPVRYALWLAQVVRGNFGYSYYTYDAVLREIAVRVMPTVELTLTALALGTVIGVAFGVVSALRQYSILDYVLSVASLFGLAIPTFFFALVALYLFAVVFPILPVFGMSTTGFFPLHDNLYHLIMPAGVLSLDLMASVTRYTRTAMLEVLNSDYVTTARAKGLSEHVVIGRHAFRNALLPLITITTLRLPYLFGGAIIVETMFSWPGMGLLAVDSIHARDYPVLMGLTFFVAVLVLFSNLLADIMYAYADPRVRYP